MAYDFAQQPILSAVSVAGYVGGILDALARPYIHEGSNSTPNSGIRVTMRWKPHAVFLLDLMGLQHIVPFTNRHDMTTVIDIRRNRDVLGVLDRYGDYLLIRREQFAVLQEFVGIAAWHPQGLSRRRYSSEELERRWELHQKLLELKKRDKDLWKGYRV